MHEGVNLLKKVFNESCSATSKTPYRIQSDLSYDLRVERYSMPPCPSHFRHAYSDLQGLYEIATMLLLLLLDQTYRRFRAKVATYVQSDLRYDLR